MEISPFCNTFSSSCATENAVNVGVYRSQKFPLMLRPPHIRPPGVSSLLPSFSQAKLGNLRKLCRSHTEQEARAESKPHATPIPPHSKFFGACLKTFPSSRLSSLCRDTRAIVHSCGRLEAEIAAHCPHTSSHARTQTCQQPSLTPIHTWATPTLLSHRSHQEGTARGWCCQVTSVCLPLSSLCQLN